MIYYSQKLCLLILFHTFLTFRIAHYEAKPLKMVVFLCHKTLLFSYGAHLQTEHTYAFRVAAILAFNLIRG